MARGGVRNWQQIAGAGRWNRAILLAPILLLLPPITFFRQQRTNIGLIFKAGHNSVMKGEGGGR